MVKKKFDVHFAHVPLQGTEIKGSGLIKVEKISRQPHVEAVALILLAAFGWI